MSAPLITIQLDPGRRDYAPGETLAGRFRWDVEHPDRVSSVEMSILWYTEGKGDEDLGVHYFEEHTIGGQAPHRVAWRPFSTKLPNSPLCYDGPLIKIRWCVRVRVFLETGKDVVGEKHFRLGHVPAPCQAPPAAAMIADKSKAPEPDGFGESTQW